MVRRTIEVELQKIKKSADGANLFGNASVDKLQFPRLHFLYSVPHSTEPKYLAHTRSWSIFEMYCQVLLSVTLLLAGTANAQFQFFENMFGGHQGGHQQQQQANAPSDSSWYQQNWDQGTFRYGTRLVAEAS